MTPALFAVPANPYPVTFTQPNGDTLTVMMKGDERIHWHESMDGYTLLLNQTGYLTYAQLDEDGNLQSSEFIATNIEERNFVVLSFLHTIDKKLFYSDMQRQLMQKVWEIEDEYESRGDRAITGQYKTLCAFVQFPNKSFIKTMDQFVGLMNQLGYTGNGTGSVRDFFKESSYNLFDLDITLCGIYTAPQNESYYAGSPGDGTLNCRELARWVAQQVAAEPNINFADYDNKGNGIIEGFHFIFAGTGQEAGGCGTCIWSHSWSFSPSVCKNGKCISKYSCSPELLSGSTMTTVGVICHEMTHAVLGTPDFYDTNLGTGGQYTGTGNWDLMANGSWNGSPGGNRPALHNMYTKIQLGWVVPVVLNIPTTIINMPNAAENPVAYKIVANGNEHYLLENRQRIKFDTSIPGDGLIIYHVYSNVGTSCINCTHPQKMYPVCASSTVAIPVSGSSNYGSINSAGCPFPGTSGKTAFNGTSTPRMFYWTNTVISNKPITNITHSNRFISFDFMGGTPVTPVSGITGVPTSFTAGEQLTLSGTVTPSGATYQTIIWSLKNQGATGAILNGNTLIAEIPGTVVVTATIENGLAIGYPFTQDFTITVNKPTLTGSVSISGLAVFGETLTANTSNLTSIPVISNLGVLTYQWKRGATEIGFNSSTYVTVIEDIGSTITVTVSANYCNESITSMPTNIITKVSQMPPLAPSLLIASTTYITLASNKECEYRMDYGNWQASPTFTNLSPNTTYSFQARKAETPTHFPSDPSPVSQFSTTEIPTYLIRATVNDPTFGTITPDGITVIEEGGSQIYTINPYPHYHIDSVFVNEENNEEAVNAGTFTFEDVMSDQTIYAVFFPDTYTVTFMPNGGEGEMEPQTFTFGEAQNLTPNTFVRTGYTFEGWNTKADGSETSYDDEQNIAIEDDMLLFAQWEMIPPNEYTIMITANYSGFIDPEGEVKVLEGESLTISLLCGDDYFISDILVDGESIDLVSEYVFTDIHSDHTFHVAFLYIDITESYEANSIQIIPNPTTGELRIMNNEQLTMNNVEIYDVYGRKMEIPRFARTDVIPNGAQRNEESHTINIANFSAGIYLVRITTEKGTIIKKVVKY
jgi:M6 family metalloprotease-like protein/uncharacterized repeat protein (TIGR02543 family)